MTISAFKFIKTDSNIASVFFESANIHSELIALKGNGGLGKVYTYSEVSQLVKSLAAGLQEDIYNDCSEIGILSENRPEWGIAYLAILAAGKTVVPIDANLKENEIDYIIEKANLKTIFTSVRFESSLSQISEIKLLSFNEASPNSWLNLSKSETYKPSSKMNDTAVLIFTSGTTGASKAVELTHKNLLSNLSATASSHL